MELGKRGIPKLRELLKRQRGDSESSDAPDIEFIYDDADHPLAELAELYSYTEYTDFEPNKNCFTEHFQQYGHHDGGWRSADDSLRSNYLLHLLNDIEMADRERRLKLLRSILYLCQGVFGECDTELEQMACARHNVFLLYESGFFVILVDLLNLEAENGLAASSALRKPAVSIADSTELRIILSLLYTIVETMRVECEDDTAHQHEMRAAFATELGMPMFNNEPVAIMLFNMIIKFCNGTAPHFPIKKVLLLLWKTILVSMGSMSEHFSAKNEARKAAGLSEWPEDTVEVCKKIRASTPPSTGMDFADNRKNKQRAQAWKNFSSTAISESMDSFDPFSDDHEEEEEEDTTPGTPRPGSPVQAVAPLPPIIKSLPWRSKVRVKELEAFLEQTRQKFVGFRVASDHQSLAGLPQPIHEGVKVLKQHMYTSLAEVQVKREEEITKNPLSRPEVDIPETAPEALYRAMLPNLPQYMISLLKLLLAAAPTCKAKTESINILADVLPEEMPSTVLDSMKLGIDVNRHKEIIVKSISGLFLLLLKWFKLNHIYQFEFMSQHLVFANCIPLVIKFFNQNILSYVQARNSINVLDFPSCVIGEQVELTAETLEAGDLQTCCWRNMFSCINLLRILNKLTKWKHSRTMMLIIFKSAPILKRALKVKHAMMQVYVLKLIKLQTKYLGRQWRKSNMKTMSAIYNKVRHRLTDDWAYGNDMDARPWDFQAEEYALRSCVDRFNNRRYVNEGHDPEFRPVDNNLQSILGDEVQLTVEYKMNYEKWLEREVHGQQIDWDLVLQH